MPDASDSAAFTALLFHSFGGPNQPADVRPFLENVTRGRGVPPERLEEVVDHYLHFGGVSPINRLNLDMIAVTLGNSSCEIGFSLKQSQLKDALDALRPLQKEYPDFALTSHANVVKLTVEGSGMALRHGVAARLFSLLAAANIRVQLITTSETKIELCIDAIDAAKAVEEIQNNLMRELR